MSSMCLDFPTTDHADETEDNEFQVRKHTRIRSADTPYYARNTLMGLPTELRIIIYQFVMQDVVDAILYRAPDSIDFIERMEIVIHRACQDNDLTIANETRSPSSVPLGRCSVQSSQRVAPLGALALPHTTSQLRKESLDVYGPFLKVHHDRIWKHYIGLQDMARRASKHERRQLLDAEINAYSRWCTVALLQRRINCMYCNDCFIRGYFRELHTEDKSSEWHARI